MKNLPKLKQKLEVKKYHGIEIKDEYSWIHQKNILEVLKDSSKLNPEVREYLEEENEYTKFKILYASVTDMLEDCTVFDSPNLNLPEAFNVCKVLHKYSICQI